MESPARLVRKSEFGGPHRLLRPHSSGRPLRTLRRLAATPPREELRPAKSPTRTVRVQLKDGPLIVARGNNESELLQDVSARADAEWMKSPAQPFDQGKNESDGSAIPGKPENHPPPDGESDDSRKHPEAGQMPTIAGIQWENKTVRGKFTGIEAWHSPDGARNRAGKTYLGKIGLRELAAWSKLSPAEFEQMALAWVELKRAAKGITE